MDLLQNPFHILAASPRDSRRRIVELAEERSLLLDSNECTQARAILTNPRKRLSAEIAWLPGFEPESTGEILALLDSRPEAIRNIADLPSLARTNLLAAGLARLKRYSPQKVTMWILDIASEFENVRPEALQIVINEGRAVSGFPEIAELPLIERALQERRQYYKQVIRDALNNLQPEQLVRAVTRVVERATSNGEEQGPILIADLVDSYEVETQAFREEEEENIKKLVKRLRTAVDAGKPNSTLTPMVDDLIRIVKNWDAVAQPIQLSTKGRGLEHAASNEVAKLVRDLALHLFNEHRKLTLSQKLTGMLQEVFAEVVKVAELAEEDADALEEIRDSISDPTEKLRENIGYKAQWGIIFVDRVRISSDGIEWKNRFWEFDSISRVRWGGTRDGYTGKVTYKVFFGNNSASAMMELKDETVYKNVVERLWITVGIRLLTKYLEGLREGKTYRFGSAILSDDGMEIVMSREKYAEQLRSELSRADLFSNNKLYVKTRRLTPDHLNPPKVFCRWSELRIWDESGHFCIGKKGDAGLRVACSYQNEDNIHILAGALRMFWKLSGEDRLSTLLQGIKPYE